jgi:hypothetical protein
MHLADVPFHGRRRKRYIEPLFKAVAIDLVDVFD